MENNYVQQNTFIKWLGLFFIILLLTVISYIAGKSTSQIKQVPSSVSQTVSPTFTPQHPLIEVTLAPNPTWTKPVSTEKGYVFMDYLHPSPSFYDFKTGTLKVLPISIQNGSGTSGVGSDGPHTAPNLYYTAFIDKDTNELKLLLHDTLQTEVIDAQHVDYMTGWSPDSSKLIYHVSADDVLLRKQGPGGNPLEKPELFQKGIKPGFYVFDLNTGLTLNLYPLPTIEQFIDNNHILTVSRAYGSSSSYISFDLNTFVANYIMQTDRDLSQFSFTNDGRYWTFSSSSHPTTDSSIVFAAFPQDQGTTVETGAWADFQFPSFSPDGKSLIYFKKDGEYSPNRPKDVLYNYDIATNKKNAYIDGLSATWVDNNTIILQRLDDINKNTTGYYLLNLGTKETKKIYP